MVFDISSIPLNIDRIFISGLLFFVSFLVAYIVWSFILRLTSKLFSKSKLYFIPALLKEGGYSIIIIFLLLSSYISLFYFDSTLTGPTFKKVWGVLIIIFLAEIIAKVLLSAVDIYGRKAKTTKMFISSRVSALKRIVGVSIYSLAMLLILNFLSSEIGLVVTIFAVIFILFLFFLYFNQLKNIITSFKLTTIVKEGDYIKIGDVEGTIQRMLEQYVLVKKDTGAIAYIPNHKFFEEKFENLSTNEGNFLMLTVTISNNSKSSNLKKLKETISSVCSAKILEDKGTVHEFHPKVSIVEINEGNTTFLVKFKTYQNSDILGIVDSLLLSLKNEFKSDLVDAGVFN